MYIFNRATCYRCKAPLKISIWTNGPETDALYTWLQHSPLDLSLNIVMYKKVGSKICRCCPVCYKFPIGPRQLMNRETGKGFQEPVMPYTKQEIHQWFRDGSEFVKHNPIERAPLALTAAYWLLVPGLYLWFRPIVIQMYLIDYGDLDI